MVLRRSLLFFITHVLAVWVALLFVPADARPEGNAIKPGDQVSIHFTCRFKNGDVAVTSYAPVADDSKQRKSVVFIRRKTDEPVSLTVKAPDSAAGPGDERGFEDEVLFRLSAAIAGLKPEARRTLEISAERRPGTTSSASPG